MINKLKTYLSSKKNCATLAVAMLLIVALAIPAYSYFSSRAEGKTNPFSLVKKWSYTIAFDGNGATSGTMTPITDIKTNQIVQLTPNAFARKGYEFKGWSLTADGEVEFEDKQNVSNLTETDGATVTLYAVWDPLPYIVHFNANGGTGEMEDQQFFVDEEKALSENLFIKLNSTFKGWSLNPSSFDTDFSDKEVVVNLVEDVETNNEITLYAVWDSNNTVREGYYRIIVVSEKGGDAYFKHSDIDNPDADVNDYFEGHKGSYFEGIFYVTQGTELVAYPYADEGDLGATYICYSEKDPTEIDGLKLVETLISNNED